MSLALPNTPLARLPKGVPPALPGYAGGYLLQCVPDGLCPQAAQYSETEVGEQSAEDWVALARRHDDGILAVFLGVATQPAPFRTSAMSTNFWGAVRRALAGRRGPQTGRPRQRPLEVKRTQLACGADCGADWIRLFQDGSSLSLPRGRLSSRAAGRACCAFLLSSTGGRWGGGRPLADPFHKNRW